MKRHRHSGLKGHGYTMVYVRWKEVDGLWLVSFTRPVLGLSGCKCGLSGPSGGGHSSPAVSGCSCRLTNRYTNFQKKIS